MKTLREVKIGETAKVVKLHGDFLVRLYLKFLVAFFSLAFI